MCAVVTCEYRWPDARAYMWRSEGSLVVDLYLLLYLVSVIFLL